LSGDGRGTDGRTDGIVTDGSANGTVTDGTADGGVDGNTDGRADGNTVGSGERRDVLVGAGVALAVGTTGGAVFGVTVRAGADVVVRGDDVAAEACGLGVVVAGAAGAPAGAEAPGADGSALGALNGRPGKSPIGRPSRASRLRLNAASARATAIDGPRRTYSAKDVRPPGAFSRLPESPAFPPIPPFVYVGWQLFKWRSRRNQGLPNESKVLLPKPNFDSIVVRTSSR
jgi:hypothetical protein